MPNHNVPKFISPSGLDTWLKNEEEYFLKYLAVDKPPKFPQTQPMSVGSAFDAYIKCFLHRKLFGPNHKHSVEFDFDTLFEKQVEPQNRDFAKGAGAVCYVAYRDSGALGHLLAMLQKAPEEPRFEFTEIAHAADHGVYNTVKATGKAQETLSLRGLWSNNPVVILGKPDLFFKLKTSEYDVLNIILDWKVNGYVSQSGKTPTPGYLNMWDGFANKSKNHGASHRDAIPYHEGDFVYSLHPNIEQQEEGWARQISSYSWICGAEVGSDIIACVDQLACKPSFPNPMVTIAQHRCPITPEFQIKTYEQFQRLWDLAHSDHYFHRMTKEQSQQRCEVLMKQGQIYQGDDPKTQWLRTLRQH